MVQVMKHGRSLLVMLAVLAIAVAACSSSGGKATNKATNGATQSVVATSSGAVESQAVQSQGTGDLTGLDAAFDNITAYKFTLVMAGDTFSSLTALGGSAASGGSFTMSGTVISKPAPAADIQMLGFHIIEVDGVDYIDMGGAGTFIAAPVQAGTTGMAESLSAKSLFGSMSSAISGANKVGTEQKNGVTADHYVATQASIASLVTEYAPGGTGTGEIWVAQNGGYPVSVKISATKTDGSIGIGFQMEITNVNDTSLKVTKPTNVTGS